MMIRLHCPKEKGRKSHCYKTIKKETEKTEKNALTGGWPN